MPLAKDLAVDETSWALMFDDLVDTDLAAIRSIFPSFDSCRADDLRSNDEFVATLWNHQTTLRPEIIEPLFERFKRDKAQDVSYLVNLKADLESHGLNCTTAGRNFVSAAETADLVVIDLYLDSSQDGDAMRNSVHGLRRVIDKRIGKPPLVVLMSRSFRLEEKRKEFRDGSGLFESAFRIIHKTDLSDKGKLQRVLTRLAVHSSDSLKLAAFLHAWLNGVSNACRRTGDLIRTLDLADLAQIRQLLLAGEGEPPGSYLVEVFDLVLQHEIEREEAIIDAALQLNDVNSDTYPPPYVSGSPDLQALVCRSLFQNDGRLRLRNPNASPVLFGDILSRKTISVQSGITSEGAGVSPDVDIHLRDVGLQDVLVVMTPACDLQRQPITRVLLLRGTLVPLTPANWSYDETPIRTTIFEGASKERFLIKWDLKHIETINPKDLKKLLTSPTGFQLVARLREAPALELQQKLLTSMGRIGIIAPLPATFSVSIDIYVVTPEAKLSKIFIPALAKHQSVCFSGRRDSKQARMLVLCEDACEALCEAILLIDSTTVHPSTLPAFEALRRSNALMAFQRGVDFPIASDQSYREMHCIMPATADKPAEKLVIGLLRGEGSWLNDSCSQHMSVLKKAGLVFVVAEPK